MYPPELTLDDDQTHTHISLSPNELTKQTARLLVKVGRKLAAAAGCEDLPWEFHVIDDENIMNAAVRFFL